MPKMTLFAKRETNLDPMQAAKDDRPVWLKIGTGVLIFVLICTFVYLFCPYTRIQALVCSGNYYFTPQQIYGIADVSVNQRTYLNLPQQMEKKLLANPLIESADVYYFYGRDFHRLALNYIQVAVGTSGVFDSEVKVDIGEVVFVVACCERQQRQREQHHREDFIHNSNMA